MPVVLEDRDVSTGRLDDLGGAGSIGHPGFNANNIHTRPSLEDSPLGIDHERTGVVLEAGVIEMPLRAV